MTIHKVCLCLVALAAALASGCETSKPATYQGYVEGEFVYIGGKIGGRLDALRVTRGDVVTAGQTLYVLEHAYETQGLALAEADYRQALEILHDKQKGLRTEEIDQIVADLRRAEAAHESIHDVWYVFVLSARDSRGVGRISFRPGPALGSLSCPRRTSRNLL